MNKYIIYVIALLLAFLTQPVQAQRSGGAYSRTAASIVSRYKRDLTQKAKVMRVLPPDSVEVGMSPYLYRLVGPGVFYRSVVTDRFRLNGGERDFMQGAMTDVLERQRSMDDMIEGALFDVYGSRPELIHYYDAQIESEKIVTPAMTAGAKKEDLDPIYQKTEGIKDVTEVVGDVDVDIQIVKPNFWTTKGIFKLQFTQNYFSENWYKGGNNNVTMLSNLVLEANYNDQNRVTWDNKLDLRLGFVTATSDSIHRYLTNNDKIYLYSKLGIKAAKNWYYTVSTEANTQFLPGHKANDRRTYSRFLAPLDVYVSLGMDWKPKFKNGNTFSLALLPFSYKMRYINDEEETIHASYNMRDKDFQQDFGSKIEFNSRISIVKNLTWRCRFYYFTSYKYCESEMENVFSFQFNKYISSEVYTLWRFDDNRDKKFYDDTLGYFQFKEYFTLGLAYNF